MTAKKQILVFLGLTLPLSWGFELYLVLYGGVKSFGLFGLVALMWIPGVASVVVRILSRSGFGDVSFQIGKARFYFFAVSIPVTLAFATNFLCELFEIRNFSPISADRLQQVIPLLFMNLGLGLVGAFGEELGWRGFLLPKLVDANISRLFLVSGIIWALWHLPIIGFGDYYASKQIFLLCTTYAASIVSLNFVVSELRMRSGSVWVATVFHGSHNFFFQLVFPFLLFTIPGKRVDLWEILGADCGFIVAILYLATFFLMKKGIFLSLSKTH